jgi:hypothetical protein
MKSRPPVMRPALLAGLFVSIILVSCGDTESKEQKSTPSIEQETGGVDAAEDKELDKATALLVKKYEQQFLTKISTECPHVCQREHHKLTSISRDSFFVDIGNSNYERLTPDIIRVPWPHFRGRVLGNYPGENLERGVVFCFGLDDKFEFKLGINVVLLRPHDVNEWRFDSLENATMYVVEKGQLVTITRENWKRRYADRYKEHVRVLSPNGAYRPLSDCDHLEYIMPWESEIMLLGEHNSDVAMSTDIVFSLAAERIACFQDTTNVQLRQFIMGHLRGYLNNDPYVQGREFRRRATDLGTPCPPRCGKFVIVPKQHCQNRQNCD